MNNIKKHLPLIAVSWGHFVNDFFMSIVPVTLFAFSKELSLSAKEMSFVLFAITTAGTFFQPLVGILIDRVQKSALLIYALILISIGMSISGFITNIYLLVIIVSTSALGSSVYHPLGSTITIHKASLSKGKSLSVFMTIGSFATVASPMVAIPMVTYWGLKSLALLMIPGLLSAYFLYLTKVQDVKWQSENKVHHKNKSIFVFLNRKQQLYMAIPMYISIVKQIIYSVVLIFGVIIMETKGYTVIQAGFAISGFMLSRSLSILIGGFISDYIGEKKTLIVFNTLVLLGLSLFVFMNGMAMTIGLILLGFALNATSTANITLTHKIIPENVNYGTGLIMGLAATISAICMLIFGALFDAYGYSVSLYILVAITLIMPLLGIFIPSQYNTD